MSRTLLLPLLAACQMQTPTLPEKRLASSLETLSAKERSPQKKLLLALSVREQGPTCDTLNAHFEDLDAGLIAIVQTEPKPPWAPMRAAECLIDSQSEAAKNEILRWMSDSNTMGLAILTVNLKEKLSPDFRQEVLRLGLNGPHQSAIQSRVKPKSMHDKELPK